MSRDKKMSELTPLERGIGYMILGILGTVAGIVYALLLLYLRNAGKVFLMYMALIFVPIATVTLQSVWEHFQERERNKEKPKDEFV